MKEEEKKELEELQAKDQLTDDETARAAELEEMQADEPQPTDEEEFDAAFAEATGEKPPQKEDEEKDPEPTQKKEDEPDDDNKQDTDSIFNGAPDDGKPSDTDSTGDEDDPENIITQLKADLKKERQRTKSWEGRIEAANRRAKELEERLKEKDSLSGQDNLSPDSGEEDEVLEEFIEEFPSLEGPIKVLIKREAGKMVKTELDKIRPTLERAETASQMSEEEAEVRHFETINKAHPDWKKIWESGALETWIDNQPKFLQTALKLVVKEGDAEEIVEMFDSYKKATKPTRKLDNPVSTSKKKDKLKGLEAVESQSGGPPKQKKKIGKDDFDSAWADATS